MLLSITNLSMFAKTQELCHHEVKAVSLQVLLRQLVQTTYVIFSLLLVAGETTQGTKIKLQEQQ